MLKLLPLCLLLLCPSLPAAERLVWGLLPTPGHVNVVDGKPKDGAALESLWLLARHLPDIEMEYQLVNAPRLDRALSEGAPLCTSGSIRTAKRDRHAYFVPFLLVTPMQLIVRAGEQERFPRRDGRVLLPQLFADPQLRGAISTSRVYPQPLAATLEQAHHAGQLQALGVWTDQLLLMLSHGPFDYSFEFMAPVRAIARNPQQDAALTTLPLAEFDQMAESGVYCSRSAWGRAMAERLDAAVRALAAEQQPLLEFYRRHLTAESYRDYAPAIAAHYRQRAQGPSRFE